MKTNQYDVKVIKRELRSEDGCWVIHCVPVLDQHTVDGEKFDLERLKKIADNMNKRTPAAIIIGHTEDDSNDELPIVGYAKNWKVIDGILCCDMYFYDKDTPKLYPRRSAEIWVEHDIIDPIAVLGSTPPSRPLPILHVVDNTNVTSNRNSSILYNNLGYKVMRYSLPYLVFSEYTDKEEDTGESAMASNLGTERDLINAVMEAIMETPEWKFLQQLFSEWNQVREMMQKEEGELQGGDLKPQADVEQGQQAEEDEAVEKEPETEQEVPSDKEQSVGNVVDTVLSEEEGEKVRKQEADDDDDVVKQQIHTTPPFTPRADVVKRSIKTVSQVSRRLKELESENRMLKRKYKLSLLYAEGYAINPEEEAEITKEMSDKSFEKYLVTLRNRATKRLSGSSIPVIRHSMSDVSDINIDADTMRKIIKYAMDNKVSYDEAKRHVLREVIQ